MSDPTPYTLGYSFTGFQVNAPNTPLPAPALDNELLDVATSIASVIDAVKSVRRNDGALNNGIVTFDSLSLALQLMFDPTNANLVAGAVAAAQAAATATAADRVAVDADVAAAAASAAAAAASAGSVNLTLFLAKANNLAGLGSLSTSRGNLGLGSAATFNVGTAASDVVQLDGNAKLPAVDGSQLTNIDVLPVGAVVLFPSAAAPAGTLKVNGALLSRATFSRLWAFAQAGGVVATEASWFAGVSGAFSSGDLVTNFRLPDFRGEFIRSFDDGRGLDAGRGPGAVQQDSLKDHTHGYIAPALGVGTGTSVNYFDSSNAAANTGTVNAPNGGGTETRPRNVPLLACIKY